MKASGLLFLVTLLLVSCLTLNVRCANEFINGGLYGYPDRGALLGPAIGLLCSSTGCVAGTGNTAPICCDEVHCRAGTIPTPIGKNTCCNLNDVTATGCQKNQFDPAYDTFNLYKIRTTSTDIACTTVSGVFACRKASGTSTYLCDEKECWHQASSYNMYCSDEKTCVQAASAINSFCCDSQSCRESLAATDPNAQICCTKTTVGGTTTWSCAWLPGGFLRVNGGLNVCTVNGCTRKLSTYAPLEWSATNPMCAGTRQSPINIKHKKTRKSSSKYRPINIRRRMIGMDWESEKWTMTNEQLTVILKPVNVDHTVQLSSDRSDDYRLDSLIFRWGGSEHRINGRQFAMEAQLKFTRMDNPSKFAFISFLIDYAEKGTEQTHPMLDQIVRSLPSIKAENSKVEVFFQLRKLFPLKVKKFYVYTGSLTMPDCSEGVRWFVARNRVSFKVSQTEINAFQSIENLFNKRVLTNSRPVQSSNGRKIYRSF